MTKIYFNMSAESVRYTCPMCNGKGHCDKRELSTKYARSGFLLPPLNDQSGSSIPFVKPENNEILVAKASGDVHSPTLTHGYPSKSFKDINPATNMGDYSVMLEHDFLGVPEVFQNPQEVLKTELQKLKENQWESSTPAVINLMQISRFRPELLDPHMPILNRCLCSLMRNTRSQIVRTACQIAMELYKTVQYVQRPEFDELAAMLLLKSTHINKGIRYDAKRALDAMICNLPSATCIRVLASEHGACHKNPFIRATVSRLIHEIVKLIGVESLLTNQTMKDTRKRIFTMTAKFLLDGNHEARNNAKDLLRTLMEHPDFESLFYQDVDRKLIEKIEKQFVALKYGNSGS